MCFIVSPSNKHGSMIHWRTTCCNENRIINNATYKDNINLKINRTNTVNIEYKAVCVIRAMSCKQLKGKLQIEN